ncbi:hypothetical protein DFH06DRAFT_1173094 [Mycena polygramma]|nr:hypothetical protein DFH06DRAFT_1173094 [Mycena polygramma]
MRCRALCPFIRTWTMCVRFVRGVRGLRPVDQAVCLSPRSLAPCAAISAAASPRPVCLSRAAAAFSSGDVVREPGNRGRSISGIHGTREVLDRPDSRGVAEEKIVRGPKWMTLRV